MGRSSRGYVFRPTYTVENEDGEREQRTSSIWWIGYSRNGEKVRESSESTEKWRAEHLLVQRLAEMQKGEPTQRDLERVQFERLASLIRADYERKGNRSSIENRIEHLSDFFGGWSVVNMKEPAIDRYASYRLEGGAAPATVRRELAALRRMFVLAERSKLVRRVPDFSEAMPKVDNVREGFVTEEELQRLLDALPPRLKPLVEFAYITGWRKSEILGRNWEHVDWEHGWVRIDPGNTKSGEGRSFPLTDDLRALLERQRERKREVEREYGCEIEALFFYYSPQKNGTEAGARIKSFRRAWGTATEAIGKPDLIFHDLRRSCARRLARAGVPEKAIMKLCGWATRSVFDRYAILTSGDLRELASQGTALREEVRAKLEDREKDKTENNGKLRTGQDKYKSGDNGE